MPAYCPSNRLTLDWSSEATLVARLHRGEQSAFDAMYRTYRAAMTTVARRFFTNDDDADDAVQEAFIAAFRAIGTFESSCRLGTWLHRITVNACLMILRRKRRRPSVALDEAAAGPIDSRRQPDSLEQIETAAHVRDCIRQLPSAYRQVVELRDLEGLDTLETAGRLGTNEAVVKTRLYRARRTLRGLLTDPSSTS